jgi:hypothetical protein
LIMRVYLTHLHHLQLFEDVWFYLTILKSQMLEGGVLEYVNQKSLKYESKCIQVFVVYYFDKK